MSERDLIIIPVEGDGNCLFRSVSHQLYGTTQYHDLVRAVSMDYVSIEREYFSQFVVGGLERIDEYIEHQRSNGAWGDDVEIQAMSEIYDRSLEIYAYGNRPMRTFHEEYNEGTPLRLAYHGQSHYNSIVNKDKHDPLLTSLPGEFEQIQIQRAKNIAQGIEPRTENIRRARDIFDSIGQTDLEQTLSISLHNFHTDSVDVAIERSLNEQTEEQILRQAIEESKKVHEDPELSMALDVSMQVLNEDALLQQALEASKQDVEKDFLSPAVRDLLDSGFTMEQVLKAWTAVGDNPEAMIDYIFNSVLD